MSMLVPLPTPVPIRHGVVDREGWLAVAHDVLDGGGRLVSLWGSLRPSGAVACVAYAFSFESGLAWIELPLDTGEGYPDLAGLPLGKLLANWRALIDTRLTVMDTGLFGGAQPKETTA
jgi:hypothetical protein